MKRALVALIALVGVGLVLAAGNVLADGGEPSAKYETVVDDPAVRVRDALLVVNKDGSAAVGASLQNGKDLEVALMGVVVSVEGRRLPVNGTDMWLPVPAGQRAQVGSASDAGGFVVPDGVHEATRADVEFRFDDGTCVLAEVTAVARTGEHRFVYPRSGRSIGPVTTDEPPAGTNSCVPE